MNIIGGEQVASSEKMGIEVDSGNRDGIRERRAESGPQGSREESDSDISMRSTSKSLNGLKLQGHCHFHPFVSQ